MYSYTKWTDISWIHTVASRKLIYILLEKYIYTEAHKHNCSPNHQNPSKAVLGWVNGGGILHVKLYVLAVCSSTTGADNFRGVQVASDTCTYLIS